MDKSTILSELKRLKPQLVDKYGLSAIALFGSFSRNEQGPESDIDLLIDLKDASADNFFSCVFALQDNFQEKRVEVVSKGGIKPKYFEAIKNDLIYA